MLRTTIAVAALLSLTGWAGAAECGKASAKAGKKLFADNCGYCHGSDATGDGTMSSKLDHQVKDLTRLAAENDGKFPEKAVRSIVDGRDVPDHISNDMPSWGITFHVTVDTEAEVEQRICDLVAYVRSIEVTPPFRPASLSARRPRRCLGTIHSCPEVLAWSPETGKDLRRVHRRLRRRRRHGREGADRGAGPRWCCSRPGSSGTRTKDATMFDWNYESPRRGAATRSGPSASSTAATAAGTSRASRTPAPRASCFAGFGLGCSAGARTTGAASRSASAPRTSSAASPRRLGDDWPISYDDIAPYYDELERLVGLFGTRRGTSQRARRHLPAAAGAPLLRAADPAGRRGIGITVHSLAPLDHDPAAQRAPAVPLLRAVRPGLRHALQLLGALRPPAPGLETGRLKVVTGAMAREVTTDDEGRATGVSYVDTSTW